MLTVVWVLLTVVFGALVWFTSNLAYTAGAFVMLGVTGALLLNSRWISGIVAVCVTALLVVGAFYFEPGWYNSVAKVVSFTF